MSEATKLGPAAQKIADGLNDAIEGRYQTTPKQELVEAMEALIEWAMAAEDQIWSEFGTSVQRAAAEAAGEVPDPVIQRAIKALEALKNRQMR